MTRADEVRLEKSAAFLAELNGFDDARGLLQEALVRALAGHRRCPRRVAIVPFLQGAMRSIADSVSKSAKRSPIDRFADVEEADEMEPPDDAEARHHVTLERQAAAEQMLARVDELFKDDEEVRLIIYAMVDGLHDKELRDAFVID